MEFEWDETKRQKTLQKHGVDLLEAARIFYGFVIVRPDPRGVYGEERFVALGEFDNSYYEVVFTQRGDVIRLISAWKGGRRVQRKYTTGLAGRNQQDGGTG